MIKEGLKSLRGKGLKPKGFTLVELLIVIAIIGILATVVIVSLASSRGRARDTRRMADLATIRTALELYRDMNGNYPTVTGWAYSTNNAAWQSLQSQLSQFLSSLPVDPINNTPDPWYNGRYSYAYRYSTASYPGKYDLVAQLENTNTSDVCEKKCWKYHTAGGERPWCVGSPACPTPTYTYSPYLYADH